MFGQLVKRGIGAWALLWVCILSFVVPSAAQQVTDPVAVELKRRGDTAMEAGHFDAALQAYTKALAIEPAAALHYNRARALQGLGRNADALAEFEAFDAKASPDLKSVVSDFDEMKEQVSRQIAELQVECSVEDATLRFNGQAIPLPLKAPLRFDPSTIVFEIAAPNYESFKTRLTLFAGDSKILKPELKRQDLRATLSITSKLSGTLVQMDGNTMGAVPLDLQVAPGEHRLRYSHPGYRDIQSSLVLRSKERRHVAVTLDRLPLWYETWWFWTAAGAVVTTSIVAGVAFSTERSAGAGDIAPGRISAPIIVQTR